MFNKIKLLLKRWKQRHIIKKEFAQFEGSHEELPLGEQFALKSFDTVELDWSGKRLKFVIGNINAVDLVFCGRFPNIHATLINDLLKRQGELSKETEMEVDIAKLQKEEDLFNEEICKKTLIKPSYNELYESMISLKKKLNIDFNPTSIKEVFPSDFLQALQSYHFNRLLNIVKKNSEQ